MPYKTRESEIAHKTGKNVLHRVTILLIIQTGTIGNTWELLQTFITQIPRLGLL